MDAIVDRARARTPRGDGTSPNRWRAPRRRVGEGARARCELPRVGGKAAPRSGCSCRKQSRTSRPRSPPACASYDRLVRSAIATRNCWGPPPGAEAHRHAKWQHQSPDRVPYPALQRYRRERGARPSRRGVRDVAARSYTGDPDRGVSLEASGEPVRAVGHADRRSRRCADRLCRLAALADAFRRANLRGAARSGRGRASRLPAPRRVRSPAGRGNEGVSARGGVHAV